jgi:hypothetical protein
MFEIELKNPEEIVIKCKDRAVNINVAQSSVSATGLLVGKIVGAGEFEIGEATIVGIASGGHVIYRVEINGVKIGIVGEIEKTGDLDELGPVDILGAYSTKIVSLVEPKIVIPMGTMDYTELKAEVKVEKKLKIKNESSLPTIMEVWKLD